MDWTTEARAEREATERAIYSEGEANDYAESEAIAYRRARRPASLRLPRTAGIPTIKRAEAVARYGARRVAEAEAEAARLGLRFRAADIGEADYELED